MYLFICQNYKNNFPSSHGNSLRLPCTQGAIHIVTGTTYTQPLNADLCHARWRQIFYDDLLMHLCFTCFSCFSVYVFMCVCVCVWDNVPLFLFLHQQRQYLEEERTPGGFAHSWESHISLVLSPRPVLPTKIQPNPYPVDTVFSNTRLLLFSASAR